MVSRNGSELVSVIMPVCGTQRYLAAAARSVLAQRDVALELVVINDSSRDGCSRVLSKFDDARVRVVDGPCRGIAEALNVGLRAARGSIIAKCDSDDLFTPGRLAFQARWLRSHPEYGAVCGGFSTISRFGFHIADMGCGSEPGEITDELREGTLRTSFCTFATSAQLLHDLGGFRPFFRSAEDIDLQFRLSEACRIWFHPSVVYHYRIHDASFTHQLSGSEQLFYEASARWLQRQRAGAQLDELQRNCPSPLLTEPVEIRVPRPPAAVHVQSLLLRKAWQLHQRGFKIRSVLTGFQAVLNEPTRLPVWKSVAALMLKDPPRERRAPTPQRQLASSASPAPHGRLHRTEARRA